LNKLFTQKRISFSKKKLLKMIKQLLFSLFILSQFSFAQNYGTLRFTTYADDRQSAFSLTFDDGLLSHSENVRPILNQYGFKGTFYVLPPYLTETLPGIWRYGTWPAFQSMASEGHEIGSHTMRHYDLTSLQWGDVNDDSTLLYELYQSKIFIEQKIPTEKCISLNYPYTYHNSLVDSAADLFYENGRTLGQIPNDSSLTNEDWFGLKAKVVLFDMPRNSVSDDIDELITFLEWTQNSVNNRKWGMIIIHDVVPFAQLQELLNQGIYEPISNEWLTSLCDYLWARSSSKEVWVETVGNITRYIKERDVADYQIVSSSNQLIQINVSDNLDNTIFNYPLSAYVKIPNEWNYVRTEQNGMIDTLTTIVTDTGRVVLTKVVPDKGILKLTPVTPTTIEDEFVNISKFELYQNYPNPFNPSTNIRYSVNSSQFVSLKVYDVLGNEIASLVDEYKSAGMYNVQFTMHNTQLSSGFYFYQLKAGDYFETKKMTYLK
jgi:peptidoglycan/xylan/chitin deacetylase (PgdA/CDA1 family)